MCLSTVYKNTMAPETIVMKNVMRIDCKDGCVILADLAAQLEKAGSHAAYEQVMAAVSDFEKGNMRLSVVLASLNAQ